MVWLVSALVVVAVAAAVATVLVPRAAQRVLDRLVADLVLRLEDEAGGARATVAVSTPPVQALRLLQRSELPAGRVVLEDARLDNGMRVRRAELMVTGSGAPGMLVAHLAPSDISRMLGTPGLTVLARGGRLRLAAGPVSIGVQVAAVDGRVALRVPVAPPPIGSMVAAGLTELVPPPPAWVDLDEVRVVEGDVVVRARVDLEGLAGSGLGGRR